MTEALVLCCLKMYFFVPSVISNGIRRGGGGRGDAGRENYHCISVLSIVTSLSSSLMPATERHIE